MKHKKIHHKLLISVIICSIILLLLGFGIWIRLKYAKIFINSNADNTIRSSLASKNSFNVLLAGYGGGNHDGAYLTDSLIAIHVDPKNKQLSMISIPRDIWISLPTSTNNTTNWKINAAYEIGQDDDNYPNKPDLYKGQTGGVNMLKMAVEQVTGLHIDRFVGLDFSGFRRTIDALGGVDVNVETTFDDPLYPVEGKENDLCGHTEAELPALIALASSSSAATAFPCRFESLYFPAGPNHMDGATALKYVRSRHSLQDGTDFGRSKRQRLLLEAVKSKILSLNFLPKALDFASSLQDDLRTDFSANDLSAMLEKSSDINQYQIKNIALTNQNYLSDSKSVDGQAILVPSTGNFDLIHQWIQSVISYPAVISSPLIKISNATDHNGLAEVAANRLRDRDYNVADESIANDKNLTKTEIHLIKPNIDKFVISDLEAEFGAKAVKDKTVDNPTSDILVVLGEDYYQAKAKTLLDQQ